LHEAGESNFFIEKMICKDWNGRMEWWNSGIVEWCKNGMQEEWNGGMLE